MSFADKRIGDPGPVSSSATPDGSSISCSSCFASPPPFAMTGTGHSPSKGIMSKRVVYTMRCEPSVCNCTLANLLIDGAGAGDSGQSKSVAKLGNKAHG